MARGRGSFFPTQTFDFGLLGSPRTFNQTALPKGGQLGMVVEWDNKVWRLVQVDTSLSAIDSLDGGVAYWADKSIWTVQFDASDSDSESKANGVAGGCHVVVDVSDLVDAYIFLQIGGDQAAVVVDSGSTIIGSNLAGSVTADNQLIYTAEDTLPANKQVAESLSVDATTTSDNGASVASSATVRWNMGALL